MGRDFDIVVKLFNKKAATLQVVVFGTIKWMQCCDVSSNTLSLLLTILPLPLCLPGEKQLQLSPAVSLPLLAKLPPRMNSFLEEKQQAAANKVEEERRKHTDTKSNYLVLDGNFCCLKEN